MSTFKGSCNCEAVKYQVSGKVQKIVNCHCDLCRKINGSAFSTYIIFLDNDFEILSGELKSHSVSENATKHFCGKCGTPIFNSDPKFSELKIVYFGTLALANELRPDINIYSESELEWVNNINSLPSFKQGIK
ncbi:MAG: GFA family protein [Methylococcales bacterium]|nr:GFA family protein [Methylococcales bacterium]